MTIRFLLNRLCHGYRVIYALAIVTLMLLASCSSITSTPTVTADSGQRWALLPIENLSTTPLAGEKAATFLETRLRRRGVSTLQIYPDSEPATLAALLDGKARFRKANKWARDTGFRYAITGAVTEWHYKTGADKEPVVGLNLKLIDIPTGQVLWQATGSRIGLGFTNLSRTANKVVADLVAQMNIRRQSVPVPFVASTAQNNFAVTAAVDTIADTTVDTTVTSTIQTLSTPAYSPIVSTPAESAATSSYGALIEEQQLTETSTNDSFVHLDTVKTQHIGDSTSTYSTSTYIEVTDPSNHLTIPGLGAAMAEESHHGLMIEYDDAPLSESTGVKNIFQETATDQASGLLVTPATEITTPVKTW